MSEVYEVPSLLDELCYMVAFVCLDDGGDSCLVGEVKDGCGEGWIKRDLAYESVLTSL